MSRTSVYRFMLLGGFLGLFFGLIHFFSGLNFGFTSIIIGDAVINALIGLLFLVAAMLLNRRNQAAIFVVILIITVSIIYSLAVGRGINFVGLIAGPFFLWQLFVLKRQGELKTND